MFPIHSLSLRLIKAGTWCSSNDSEGGDFITRFTVVFGQGTLYSHRASLRPNCVNGFRGFRNAGGSGGLAEMDQWMAASQPGERGNDTRL